MKLAFTTLACPNWSLEQAVAAARQYGYEGLELRLLDGELLRPDLDIEARRRVRELCTDAGLPIVCVDTSVRIAQPDAAARAEQIRDGLAFLELAAGWDAPMIRVFGGPPAGLDQAAARDAAIACLAPLAERGRALGVAVALETHDAFSGSAIVADVLASTPANGAGALWDTLHPFRVGDTLDEILAHLRGRLLHVHIKDGRRPADGGPNWDLTLLGEGEVPMRDILAALRADGYDGWLAVEWEKKWHPELAEPEIALPQHAELLREYLAGLAPT
ncbi:MAG TPA: sugar phosphate isomerase/epimerase [Roseiflexaceae bacterium]|nr:sugar phosphate isomerase/epimerase [Roseiflexaceae bacterium]